ncbi:Uncharacterised protein r2_g1855 [Pycnogonum litorale]
MPRKQSPLTLYDLAFKIIISKLRKWNNRTDDVLVLEQEILNPENLNLIRYLSVLPKCILREIIDRLSSQRKKYFGESAHEMVLLLPLGVRLSACLPAKAISFTVVDFMKNFSHNLKSLTVSCYEPKPKLNKSSLRTLLLWLKYLEELTVYGGRLVTMCTSLLVDEKMLPNLKHLLLNDRPDSCTCATRKNCCPCMDLMASILKNRDLRSLLFHGNTSVFTKITKTGMVLHLDTLKIKNAYVFENGLHNKLSPVVISCPNISELHLSFSCQNLSELKNLVHLKILSLNNRDLNRNTAEQTILSLHRLEELYLTAFMNISLPDLAENLPRLRYLYLCCCSFTTNNCPVIGFKCLQKLTVTSPKHNSLTTSNLHHLLSKSYRLEDIEIRGNVQSLNDDVLVNLLSCNRFTNLDRIFVSTTSLTISGLLALLTTENDLKLVYICSQLLNRRDSKDIRNCIIDNNLDASVVIVGLHGMWILVDNKVS